MSKHPMHRALAAPLVAATLIGLCAAPVDARSWSFSGRFGRTYSHSATHYNHGGGNFGRTATTTGPNGASASSTFSRSVSGNTITDSRTVTGFNGASRSATLTRTPGAGGSATYTGRDGNSYSRSWSPGTGPRAPAPYWGGWRHGWDGWVAPCCYGSGFAAATAAYLVPPVTYLASPLYAVPAAVYVP
ncbi:MAG TPA: hypothetical protein VIX87_07375 [Steroidobacteraceae bacterium]